MHRITSLTTRAEAPARPTSADARPFAPPTRHVMAGPAGQGGVTVTATPLADVTAVVPGPGLLALADLIVVGTEETTLGDAVVAWREGGSVWLRLRSQGLGIVLEERRNAAQLADLPPASDPGTGRFVWAVVDARIGEVAARAFAGSRDDDAVGFRGAMALTRRAGRPLLVRLATGSVLTTRPAPGGRVEIGGAAGPPVASPADGTRPRPFSGGR